MEEIFNVSRVLLNIVYVNTLEDVNTVSQFSERNFPHVDVFHLTHPSFFPCVSHSLVFTLRLWRNHIGLLLWLMARRWKLLPRLKLLQKGAACMGGQAYLWNMLIDHPTFSSLFNLYSIPTTFSFHIVVVIFFFSYYYYYYYYSCWCWCLLRFAHIQKRHLHARIRQWVVDFIALLSAKHIYSKPTTNSRWGWRKIACGFLPFYRLPQSPKEFSIWAYIYIIGFFDQPLSIFFFFYSRYVDGTSHIHIYILDSISFFMLFWNQSRNEWWNEIFRKGFFIYPLQLKI